MRAQKAQNDGDHKAEKDEKKGRKNFHAQQPGKSNQ